VFAIAGIAATVCSFCIPYRRAETLAGAAPA